MNFITNRKVNKCVRLLTDDGLLTIVAVIVIVVLVVYLYVVGDYYQSRVAFFDYLQPITPNPYVLYWTYVWNWTWEHILENTALIVCCFMLRKYPKELAVLREMSLFVV